MKKRKIPIVPKSERDILELGVEPKKIDGYTFDELKRAFIAGYDCNFDDERTCYEGYTLFVEYFKLVYV